LLAIIGAAFVGGAAVSLWTAGEYPISNKLATLCAVYFALLVTSAASTPVLMGAKAFVSLGNIGMAEFLAAGVLCTILYFADAVSFPHVVEALIAANAMTALWMMPTQAIVRLSRGSLDAQH
ncbi:MAG TPA: hypothetical protein DD502_20930, partial [Cupriavidus sp.]|nr:hypothetical protein [Cupriavidus sp.]